MCRNIKTLHNFAPPATAEEIRASSLQFVRKLSGFSKPSKANEAAFNRAVEQVAQAATELLDSLVTNAPPRDREVEAARARARSAERFPAAVGTLTVDETRSVCCPSILRARSVRNDARRTTDACRSFRDSLWPQHHRVHRRACPEDDPARPCGRNHQARDHAAVGMQRRSRKTFCGDA